jgi:hypothetical protein
MAVLLTPPYEEWKAILASNLMMAQAVHRVIGEGCVADVRREMLEVARGYSSQLRACALKVGIPIESQSGGPLNGPRPIVMAGHQPGIYHPGILEKTKRLTMIARETGGVALNIAIDTDEGDAGRVLWPLRQGEGIHIRDGVITTPMKLYRDQRIGPKAQVAGVFAEMVRDLRASGRQEAADGAMRASRLYEALEGESAVLANAVVRKYLCGDGYDELPLSLILETPSVKAFLWRIVDDADRFTSMYNATLEAYRAEHKIKNPANPFPNMERTSEDVEVPLWEILDGVRSRVVVRPGQPSLTNSLLAPRGSIVTLLLRGVCSDLFIHGMGGAKYDQFVNAFARALWGEELPRFVVASATSYLFPERVDHYLRAREVKANYKSMVSHTADFLGKGVFSAEDEERLTPLVRRRSELLALLQNVHTKEERSPIAHELNDINRLLKGAIDASSLAPLLRDAGIDDAVLNRWRCREYPFFLGL